MTYCCYLSCSSDPPNVTLTPMNITVNESDSVTFMCETFGVPGPQIFWYNSSSPGDVGDSSTALQAQPGVLSITSGNRSHFSGFPIITSNLTIVSVLKHDETNYTCVAVNNVTNLIGTPESAASSLTVQGQYRSPAAIIVTCSLFSQFPQQYKLSTHLCWEWCTGMSPLSSLS